MKFSAQQIGIRWSVWCHVAFWTNIATVQVSVCWVLTWASDCISEHGWQEWSDPGTSPLLSVECGGREELVRASARPLLKHTDSFAFWCLSLGWGMFWFACATILLSHYLRQWSLSSLLLLTFPPLCCGVFPSLCACTKLLPLPPFKWAMTSVIWISFPFLFMNNNFLKVYITTSFSRRHHVWNTDGGNRTNIVNCTTGTLPSSSSGVQDGTYRARNITNCMRESMCTFGDTLENKSCFLIIVIHWFKYCKYSHAHYITQIFNSISMCLK